MIKGNGYLIFLIWLCFGCAWNAETVNVRISLVNTNHSLQITGFDKAILNDIARDSADVEAWQSLLPVYKMPADTDMKDFQNAQPGKYEVKDSLVVFTPDTPFQKGQVYFLRSYQYGDTKNAWDFIRQKKQKGNIRYKDLLFKY